MTDRWRRADKAAWLLLALILLYVWIFAGLAFDLHAGMRTHKSDLGQMDQAIWNTSRGRFVESIRGDQLSTRLTDHVEPIFAPVSAVFWVWDDVRALLLLQVVAVALGALPLYALAVRRLRPRAARDGKAPLPARLAALALAIAYLLSPPLQSAVLTEFHAIPLAVPLILWAFWAVEAGRWRQFALAALLVAGVKEEAALLASGLGLWAAWRSWLRAGRPGLRALPGGLPRGAWAGPAVLAASLAWFYLATFVIVPAYGAEVYDSTVSAYFQRYGPLGNSPLDIVKSFFTQPGVVAQIALEPARVRYVVALLLGFGFLGLLAPEILLLALPVFLANLLSTYPAQYYGEFHYTAPLVPYVAVAAIYGAGRLLRMRPGASLRWLPAALAAWLLLWAGVAYAQAGRGPLGGRYDPPSVSAHHRLLPRFTAQIPAGAAVSATAAVHPHVSHRRFIYQFPFGIEPPGQADWALIDVVTRSDMAPYDLYATVKAMLDGAWGVVDGADGFLLLHKGHPQKAIPDPFYDFARLPATEADTQVLPGPLVFDGLSVEDWPAWRQTQVRTTWLVGPDFVPGTVRPWLELRGPDGDTLFALDDLTPPVLIWYPPQRWQPGERIQVVTEPMSLPRSWAAAVGVVHGPDPNQPNDRLRVALALQEPGPIVGGSGTLALAGAYIRQPDGALARIAPDALLEADLGTRMAAANGQALQEARAAFRAPDGQEIGLRAWMPAAGAAALDVWLAWLAPQGLPPGYQPFLHLREAGQTRSQDDGPPRLFLVYDPAWWPEAEPQRNDWRQLAIPEGDGPWEVVVGLYNPDDGGRLEAFAVLGDGTRQAGGTEIVLGQVIAGKTPVPDQACALIPATCASQPLARAP